MSKEKLQKFKRSCEQASGLKEREVKEEKEIQDEVDKYWGQQDRIEKMLKWMVIECIPVHKRKNMTQPDISDILNDVEKT
ncbi:hypothetical protein LCGC14_1757500 [marine sediment metagenome]|uniref:Uncharacterized protein n=1 Tax=marine sediment metagenome TaxID=412755 RepID=A0A0F9HPB5_9ZZZZ